MLAKHNKKWKPNKKVKVLYFSPRILKGTKIKVFTY